MLIFDKNGLVTLLIMERAMIKCSRSVENSVADPPGCLSRIPDPNLFHPGSGSATLVESGPAFLNTGDDKVVQGEPSPPRVILRQQVVHECGTEPVSHLGQRL